MCTRPQMENHAYMKAVCLRRNFSWQKCNIYKTILSTQTQADMHGQIDTSRYTWTDRHKQADRHTDMDRSKHAVR